MQKRKSKILYIDTNVVLDFIADKDNNVVVLMKSVKSRGWKLRISTFAMIELAEYRKNEIFLWDKLSKNTSLNKIMKRIRNPRDNKKLKDFQFEQVSNWLDDLQSELPNIDFLDIGPSEGKDEISSWQLARDLSIYSNLNAKDVIHFATAIAAAQSNGCDFFITSDGEFYKGAKKIVEDLKMKNKLKILKPKDFIEKYPPIKKNEVEQN